MLTSHHTLVRYDERGNGLSDWNIQDFSFKAWVRDIEELVDTVNLERFPLLGISQGAAVAVNYAVRHPGTPGRRPADMECVRVALRQPLNRVRISVVVKAGEALI